MLSVRRLHQCPFRRRAAARPLSTLGIRREDPQRVWERRAPLTPSAIEGILRDGELRVQVETCSRRCFTDGEYERVGAQIVEELSGEVDLILGIKEPPVSEVHRLRERDRTWMVFSHTHKGQVYNTPLLAAFLGQDSKQTLVDYELLTAPTGDRTLKRIAAFGWYAGAVGAGEALVMTAQGLLKRGVASPLLHLPRPYTFPSVEAYKGGLREVGEQIRSAEQSLGREGPLVIGYTGRGNVADGFKDMLDALGVHWVPWNALPSLRSTSDDKRIFACAIPPSAYLVPKHGEKYDREDYYAQPAEYHSLFSKRTAPYLTTLINGIGWQPGFPRTMTTPDVSDLILRAGEGGHPQKLLAVQDVSCDLNGGLEFVDRHTTIDQPSFEGPGGMLISTTDILPTELPCDASEHFSSKILPYVQRLLRPQHSKAQDEISRTIERAKIVHSGQLTVKHQWLGEKVSQWQQSISSAPVSSSDSKLLDDAAKRQSALPPTQVRKQKKKVLLLGSGLVAGPAVEVFVARGDVELAIASNNTSEAEGLAKGRTGISTLLLDVTDQSALSSAVEASDVVVSLLPAPMHPQVAKHCIAHGKHLVTASYISPEMKALHDKALEKDVLLLGECGLDPGIDSMAAMRILECVQREGKRVTSFVSWCGGLPEPAASNVPFGYKFSWSPKAVLTAALNEAKYKLNGEHVIIPGDQLLANHFPSVPLWKGLALEGVANRDSIPYAEKYGMGHVDGLRDLFRGTLRYQGFSRLLNSFRQLGLLSSEILGKGLESWPDLLRQSSAKAVRYDGELKADDMTGVIRDVVGVAQAQETIEALEWLSLLPSPANMASPELATPLPQPRANEHSPPAPIDLLASVLSHKLAYAPKERDSVLLHHTFKLQSSAGMEQTVTASLLTYATPEASAMATTVGKTLAFAAGRVLDGSVRARGVKGPYEREVWYGVLGDLESAGVTVEEKWA